MTKSSPPKGPGKPFPGGFAPQGGFRPTVGLPPSAGGARPSVPLPGVARGVRPGVSKDDIIRLLKLGGAHLAAGRLDHAAKAAAAVLQVEPKNPDGMHLIGLVALAKGDTAKAEQLIAAAAALMPHHVNVWVNLGNAQRDQGKAKEALISYDRALSLDPAYADAYLQRGILYKDTSAYRDAAADFERLIELTPNAPAPYLRAAENASKRGHYREAIAYCERGLAILKPAPPALLAFLASTHELITNLEEAIRIADEVLAIEPGNPSALCTRFRARRRLNKGDKAALAELRDELEALNVGAMEPGDARMLYSELAQLCEALGDAPAAFRYFTLQNNKTSELPALKTRDLQSFSKDVERLTKYFTKEKVASWRPLPSRGIEPGHRAAPVFLVGFPRSGTTLLDQILDAHPAVQVFEELPFLRSVRNSVAAYPTSLGRMSESDREAARQVYWDELAKEGADLAGKTVVNKMPLDMVHAGLIARVFPEAKIILALRHPADCVLSCFMQDFVANGAMVNFLTLEGSARFYDQVFTLWQNCRELLALNVQEVRYERLVADLRAEVEPALGFLGLGWDDAVSDPAAHALQRGSIRTPSYSQVTQPIYSSAMERWRRYEAQMKPVLPILAPHIERLGYSL